MRRQSKRCGVYIIGLKRTDKVYTGSSNDCWERWAQHQRDLRNQKHNRYLQAAWNKYGPDAFFFKIIEDCAETSLLIREQYYIDTLNSCFNLSKLAAGGSLVSDWTPERRANHSVGMKSNTNSLGHVQTAAERAAHSDALKKHWIGKEPTEAQRVALAKGPAASPFGPGYIPTHRIGAKDSEATKAQRVASVKATRAKMGKQRWITNGVIETAIYGDATPPEGWRYGRKPRAQKT